MKKLFAIILTFAMLFTMAPLSALNTAADTDGDGSVTVDDATWLQMYLAEYDVVLGKQS